METITNLMKEKSFFLSPIFPLLKTTTIFYKLQQMGEISQLMNPIFWSIIAYNIFSGLQQQQLQKEHWSSKSGHERGQLVTLYGKHFTQHLTMMDCLGLKRLWETEVWWTSSDGPHWDTTMTGTLRSVGGNRKKIRSPTNNINMPALVRFTAKTTRDNSPQTSPSCPNTLSPPWAPGPPTPLRPPLSTTIPPPPTSQVSFI